MMSGIAVLWTVHMSGIETISGAQAEVTEGLSILQTFSQKKESDSKG